MKNPAFRRVFLSPVLSYKWLADLSVSQQAVLIRPAVGVAPCLLLSIAAQPLKIQLGYIYTLLTRGLHDTGVT